MDGKLIAERGKTKGEQRERERESEFEREVLSSGRMDSKRWSGALQHARGQSNKWAQLKTNSCLLTSPLSWLVKASRSVFVLALSPAPAPVSASEPKASSGREAGGAGRAGAGSRDGSANEDLKEDASKKSGTFLCFRTSVFSFSLKTIRLGWTFPSWRRQPRLTAVT